MLVRRGTADGGHGECVSLPFIGRLGRMRSEFVRCNVQLFPKT